MNIYNIIWVILGSYVLMKYFDLKTNLLLYIFLLLRNIITDFAFICCTELTLTNLYVLKKIPSDTFQQG